MTHITLNTAKEHQGIHFVLAIAPKDITPDTAGKDVGEIRFNPAEQKATVSLGAKTSSTWRRSDGQAAPSQNGQLKTK